jgi:hypothetical protein
MSPRPSAPGKAAGGGVGAADLGVHLGPAWCHGLIPALGLIGAPLLIASATIALFRGNDPVTVLAAIATVPIFVWELSLGVWLVVKGGSHPARRRPDCVTTVRRLRRDPRMPRRDVLVAAWPGAPWLLERLLGGPAPAIG